MVEVGEKKLLQMKAASPGIQLALKARQASACAGAHGTAVEQEWIYGPEGRQGRAEAQEGTWAGNPGGEVSGVMIHLG